MREFCTNPKDCMALAYERETEQELDQRGLDAAYADIVDSFHKEMEEFITKYCPKKLNEFDELLEKAFWQYH